MPKPKAPLFVNKLHYPTLVTWTSPDGKVHVPPEPPQVHGYPPWIPRPNEYRRETPLKKCPDKKCRRAGTCVNPHYGEFCQKTHMEREAFRAALVVKIDRLMKKKLGDDWDISPHDPNEPSPTPPPGMKRILETAQARNERAALLAWQTGWIAKVKAEYAAKPAKSRPQTPRNNHPLT